MDALLKFLYNIKCYTQSSFKEKPQIRFFLYMATAFFPIILLNLGYQDISFIICFLFGIANLDYILIIIYFLTEKIFWIISHFNLLTKTAFWLFVLVLSFFILIAMSIWIVCFINDNLLNFRMYDPVYNGEFLPVLAFCIATIFTMFILSLIFHHITHKLEAGALYYQGANLILTFFSAIFFTFMVGLNDVIANYAYLYWKTTTDIAALSAEQLESVSFYINSNCQIIMYFLFASTLTYQITFNLIYRNNNIVKTITNKEHIKDDAKQDN